MWDDEIRHGKKTTRRMNLGRWKNRNSTLGSRWGKNKSLNRPLREWEILPLKKKKKYREREKRFLFIILLLFFFPVHFLPISFSLPKYLPISLVFPSVYVFQLVLYQKKKKAHHTSNDESGRVGGQGVLCIERRCGYLRVQPKRKTTWF